MSEYQRFISYMYEYRNGKKSTNCGYARVENRNRLCRLEIHMKTSPQALEEPLRIYGCFHREGRLFGILLGQHAPVLDMVNWRYQGDPDNLNASSVPLSQLEGLILSDGSQVAYCSMWNDTIIDPNEMTPYTKAEPEPSRLTAETAAGGPPDETTSLPFGETGRDDGTDPGTSPEEYDPEEIPEEETLSSEAVPAEENTPPVPPSATQIVAPDLGPAQDAPFAGPDSRETDFTGGSGFDDGDFSADSGPDDANFSAGYGPGEDAVSAEAVPAAAPEKEDGTNAPSGPPDEPAANTGSFTDSPSEAASMLAQEPESNMADAALAFQKKQENRISPESVPGPFSHPSPWEQVQASYPRINPFTDDEIQDCVRIELKDLPMLRQNGWRIAGNRFILHSFQKNRHLILGKLKNSGRYIFAVPGYYDNQERFMANTFGFPYFKSSDGGPLRYGQKGYWYRLLY